MSAAPSETPASGGPWGIVFALFAAGNLANGLWMLVNPGHWYIHLPANVPGSGPLNEHFVRDIGCIFSLIGVALDDYHLELVEHHDSVELYLSDAFRRPLRPASCRNRSTPRLASTKSMSTMVLY
ncbi:MAG: hypothetical protein OER77_09455 [Myxococcales bacterium]|nr:hypothetical protein [Myxococcales bacterium]